jgi:hypothetical protein
MNLTEAEVRLLTGVRKCDFLVYWPGESADIVRKVRNILLPWFQLLITDHGAVKRTAQWNSHLYYEQTWKAYRVINGVMTNLVRWCYETSRWDYVRQTVVKQASKEEEEERERRNTCWRLGSKGIVNFNQQHGKSINYLQQVVKPGENRVSKIG